MTKLLKLTLILSTLLVIPTYSFSQSLELEKSDNTAFNPFDPKASREKAKNQRVQQNILVFGDSISNEFGITKGKGWVNQIQAYYLKRNKGYNFINISVNGLELIQSNNILESALKEHKPQIVILALGTTDYIKGKDVPYIRSRLSILIEDIKLYGAQPILIGMQLNGDRFKADDKDQFYRMYNSLANQKQIKLVPFFYRTINDKEDWKNNFLKDEFHPNEASQEQIMKNVLYVLDSTIKEVYPEGKNKNIQFVRNHKLND